MNTFAVEVAASVAVLCLGVLVYVYAGYPALLWVLGRLRPRPVARRRIVPSMSVLIPAHDEEELIETKVFNTLGCDYPKDRLEVLVLCDGCTDGTAERVRALAEPSVRVLELPRMGKGRALNAGAAAARGEILVLTDANILLDRWALRELAANFADSEVGGVCGNKRYVRPAPAVVEDLLVSPGGAARVGVAGSAGVRAAAAPGATARGEGLYWRYDRWVKRLESGVGSVFASDGALHALRSSLYRPIHNPASADDMAISMRVVLQGFRLVYEPRAEAVETPPDDPSDEFRRKIRVTNHSMRALLDLGPPLWRSGFYSVQLLSHKLVRHLSPLLLAGLLAGSAVATGGGAGGGTAMRLLLGGQVAFYALAALGHLLRRGGLGGRLPLAAPYHFTLIQLAALGGLASLVRGTRLAVWTPRGGLEAG